MVVYSMKLHPLFLVVLLIFYLNGEWAIIAIYFFSLVLHELGHLIAARFVRVKIESCTIYPFGGEIVIRNELLIDPLKMSIILVGGLLTTFVCIVLSYFLPPVIGEPFQRVNIFLFCLNLLPIWPLDGGRLLLTVFRKYVDYDEIYERFLMASLGIVVSSLILTSVLLNEGGLPLLFIFLFIAASIISEWRIRKYKMAYLKHVKT